MGLTWAQWFQEDQWNKKPLVNLGTVGHHPAPFLEIWAEHHIQCARTILQIFEITQNVEHYQAVWYNIIQNLQQLVYCLPKWNNLFITETLWEHAILAWLAVSCFDNDYISLYIHIDFRFYTVVSIWMIHCGVCVYVKKPICLVEILNIKQNPDSITRGQLRIS